MGVENWLLIVAERRHLVARGFNPGLDTQALRRVAEGRHLFGLDAWCRPSGTKVLAGNGDLGLKSVAIKCRRSATFGDRSHLISLPITLGRT